MEPQIPMSKITTEAEWLGKMLLKLKDVKTEEDLKNFKGLGLLLKSLIAYIIIEMQIKLHLFFVVIFLIEMFVYVGNNFYFLL